MVLFKIAGLLMIFVSCSLWGFLKAVTLKKRSTRLGDICIALEKSAQLMRSFQGDIYSLLQQAFESEILCNNTLDDTYLLKEDTELFNKFLSEIGMSCRESEYKKICLYKTLFQKQKQSADDDVNRLFKLYSSLGVLAGTSVCIFFI